MNTTTPADDQRPGRPFKEALQLLDERFPGGNRHYHPSSGEVFISLPLKNGEVFRVGLTWQQAKYLAHNRLSGDDIKDSRFPADWPH